MLHDLPDDVIRYHIIPALSVEDQIIFASLSYADFEHVEQGLEKEKTLQALTSYNTKLPGKDSSWIRFKQCLEYMKNLPEDEGERDQYLREKVPASFRAQCYFLLLKNTGCENDRKDIFKKICQSGNVSLLIAFKATFKNNAEFAAWLCKNNDNPSYAKEIEKHCVNGNHGLAKLLLPHLSSLRNIFYDCLEKIYYPEEKRICVEIFLPYLRDNELERHLLLAIKLNDFYAFSKIYSRMIVRQVEPSYLPLLYIDYQRGSEQETMRQWLECHYYSPRQRLSAMTEVAVAICKGEFLGDAKQQCKYLKKLFRSSSLVADQLKKLQPSLLMRACKALQTDIVDLLLFELWQNPNATDQYGCTALMYVANHSNFKLMHQPQINYSFFARKPMFMSGQSDSDEAKQIIKLLVKAGARCDHVDNSGLSVRDYFNDSSLSAWFEKTYFAPQDRRNFCPI